MDQSEKEEYIDPFTNAKVITHLEAASLSLTLASTYVDDPDRLLAAAKAIAVLVEAYRAL